MNEIVTMFQNVCSKVFRFSITYLGLTIILKNSKDLNINSLEIKIFPLYNNFKSLIFKTNQLIKQQILKA